ncbi:MAG: hypothetical protein CM15mP130_1150 [Verrucomicrobiota bacterium]|nr:MAG: hypothetical protein CM15mP130_1150 [Verrucomicrobiota bacterium]
MPKDPLFIYKNPKSHKTFFWSKLSLGKNNETLCYFLIVKIFEKNWKKYGYVWERAPPFEKPLHDIYESSYVYPNSLFSYSFDKYKLIYGLSQM